MDYYLFSSTLYIPISLPHHIIQLQSTTSKTKPMHLNHTSTPTHTHFKRSCHYIILHLVTIAQFLAVLKLVSGADSTELTPLSGISLVKMAAIFLRNRLCSRSGGTDNHGWWLDQRLGNCQGDSICSILIGQVKQKGTDPHSQRNWQH